MHSVGCRRSAHSEVLLAEGLGSLLLQVLGGHRLPRSSKVSWSDLCEHDRRFIPDVGTVENYEPAQTQWPDQLNYGIWTDFRHGRGAVR